MVILDKKVKRFAKQMQIEINHNKHKGGIYNWKGIEQKIADLEYHKAKMLLAMKANNKDALKEYVADCANTLLAIGDECGLYDTPSKDVEQMAVIAETPIYIVPHANTESPNFFNKITNNGFYSGY